MSNRTKKARSNALREAAGVQSASNKHVTKISAKPSADHAKNEGHKHEDQANNAIAENVLNSELITNPSTTEKPAKSDKTKPSKNDRKAEKPLKKTFILARPFVALGRYIRDSWHEIRQVRWPNRSNTWKMTAAVLAYCVFFIIFVMLLDTLFTFLFNLLVK